MLLLVCLFCYFRAHWYMLVVCMCVYVCMCLSVEMSNDLSLLFEESVGEDEFFASIGQGVPATTQPTHAANVPIHTSAASPPVHIHAPNAPMHTHVASVPMHTHAANQSTHTHAARAPVHLVQESLPVYTEPPKMYDTAQPVSEATAVSSTFANTRGPFDGPPVNISHTVPIVQTVPFVNTAPVVQTVALTETAPDANCTNTFSPAVPNSHTSPPHTSNPFADSMVPHSTPTVPMNSSHRLTTPEFGHSPHVHAQTTPRTPHVHAQTTPHTPHVHAQITSHTPPSLIATMREKQKGDILLQPEQDVIYNRKAATVVAPPPSMMAPPPRLASLSVHVALPFGQGPPPSAPLQPALYTNLTAPLQPGLHTNFSAPPQPGLHTNFSAPPPQLHTNFTAPPPHVHANPASHERPRGLAVMVSIGFGGRIVVAGGRFGMRVGLTTLGQCLFVSEPTRDWINEIHTVPGPLGTVSQLTNESIESWLSSKQQHQAVVCRFGWSSLPDSKLFAHYISLLLRGERNLKNSFLQSLWADAVHGQTDNALLFEYIQLIISNNLKQAIELSKKSFSLHPYSMAISSIHSPEYFRESILTFVNDQHASGEPLCTSVSDKRLLSLLKTTITVFASTSPLLPEITPDILEDWKIHLALIGSLIKSSPTENSTGRNFLIRLGNALCERGRCLAGQLCILLSSSSPQLESVDSVNSLICLIGVDHRKNVSRLLDPCAIQMSEIFEYAIRKRGSEPNFFAPLQPFKFAYAALLASDFGFFDIAQKYILIVNAFIKAVPTGKYSPYFRIAIRDLELRIQKSSSTKPKVQPVSTFGALWGGITGTRA